MSHSASRSSGTGSDDRDGSRSGDGSRAAGAKELREIARLDPAWSRIRQEAEELAEAEPMLGSYLHACVLKHEKLEDALAYHLAQRLSSEAVGAMMIREICDEAFASMPEIGAILRADVQAVFDRDPACSSYINPLLYYKGFHALESYRVAHYLWKAGRVPLALYMQNRISELFAVDIHPAATIGRGVFMDHATSVVIGETAVVEDDVSMLQEVTLGGTGKASGDRHPKVRRGVLIGAGAKILGNIEIGAYSRVGAGSVVLTDVPPNCTVAGVPAKIMGCAGSSQPARTMDHVFRESFGGLDGEGI